MTGRAATPALPELLWPRLASRVATLAPHVSRAQRTVRGRAWRILRNEANGTHVRVNEAMWALLSRLDGQRDVAAHVRALERQIRRSLDGDYRERLVAGLATLERAGFIALDAAQAEGSAESASRRLQRHRADRRARAQQRWRNPLMVRWPLHDPDRWLDATAALWRRGRTQHVLTGLAVLMLAALAVAWVHASELAVAASGFAATPSRWWVMLIVWPLLKGCHEAAHAIAVRRAGGRVHEFGLALLVFMPMPYVDASDASLFERRRERILVGAAGVIAELSIAAVALLAWACVEPGALRELLFVLALTGSVFSLLFNANPLLRFDGYHVLQDAIDVPNLATRSSAWWLARLRSAVGVPDAHEPPSAPGERRWLAGYGLAALAYRYVVVVAIAWWLLQTLPVVGAGLAVMALWPMVVGPVVRAFAWWAKAAPLHGRRAPVAARAGAMLLGVATVLWLPLPSSTRVQGIVALPDTANLVAAEAGQIVAVAAAAELSTAPGQWLIRLHAPALEDEAQRLDSVMQSLRAQRAAVLRSDPVTARTLADELQVARAEHDELQRRLAALTLVAPRHGRFVASTQNAIVGRHVQRGETLGQWVDEHALQVRAVLRETDLGRLHAGVKRIRVRLAEAPGQSLEAALLREVPAASRDLPSLALARRDASIAPSHRHAGIAVASEGDVVRTVEPVFHVDLGLPADSVAAGIGGRAYIAFRHDNESLMRRWWRGTRQLLLERLAV